MLSVTGTHIAYLHTCHRKLWLFAHAIRMEHTSDIVAEGKLIGATTYGERAAKYTEIEIDGCKIDFYDARNKVIHEVKKSGKMENAHVAQVKYYIYKLEKHGVTDAVGLIEYPKLRQRVDVRLSDEDRGKIPLWERDVREIVSLDVCPPVVRMGICKSCSYFDFCYSSEPGFSD